MENHPFISIIFPVKNEGIHVKTTLDSLFSAKTDQLFEAIVVDDASVDDCCDFLQTFRHKNRIKLLLTDGIGAANARNLGAEHARGDYLVFCDAHLEFEDWWLDRIIRPLIEGETNAVTPAIGAIGNPEFIGYGQTLWSNPKNNSNLRTHWNQYHHEMFDTAVLPGGCFAIEREVFEKLGGFETGFKTWGHEDVEFSIKLWLFGYRGSVLPDVKVLHLFRKQQPYHVSMDEYYYNLLRMAYLHFSPDRIQKCKKMIVKGNAEDIEQQVLRDGVSMTRERYLRKRKFDDDWYFRKFTIDY
ncbi:glycosyltransferase family 2 protein [Metabacillus sp. 84]|uniref:glycosyltransferase family 2 protein n=1 Tax=unclassified Metabacillus TaxID=2675274 RepID=UPI003CF23488